MRRPNFKPQLVYLLVEALVKYRPTTCEREVLTTNFFVYSYSFRWNQAMDYNKKPCFDQQINSVCYLASDSIWDLFVHLSLQWGRFAGARVTWPKQTDTRVVLSWALYRQLDREWCGRGNTKRHSRNFFWTQDLTHFETRWVVCNTFILWGIFHLLYTILSCGCYAVLAMTTLLHWKSVSQYRVFFATFSCIDFHLRGKLLR